MDFGHPACRHRADMEGHMKTIKNLAAFALLTACCLGVLCGCGSGQDPVLSGAAIQHEEEFGGVYIESTIEDFNALGFEYGDSVRVAFSNGYVLEDLPYYNGYYTVTGTPLLVAYPGYPFIKAGINNGDDLWRIAGLRETDTAEITLAEAGKYRAIQEARDIHYSDERSDFESDEVFANFRNVQVGALGEGVLYRSASPCDNQHNRAPFTDRLMGEVGVACILDLADTEEKLQGYLADPAFNSPAFLALYDQGKVLPAALNMNYTSQEFQQRLADALAEMAEQPGPYLVHCTEGKDRTGYVCMLLEALCGASYDELEADYMLTYENYYGITKESDPERYNAIVESVFLPMLQSLAGNTSAGLRNADFSVYAGQVLLAGGMTREQIDGLKARLMP